jgi:hypothetical protein
LAKQVKQAALMLGCCAKTILFPYVRMSIFITPALSNVLQAAVCRIRSSQDKFSISDRNVCNEVINVAGEIKLIIHNHFSISFHAIKYTAEGSTSK